MAARPGRKIGYLRVSVGDRCDLRCVYCRTASPRLDPKGEVLSFEEIVEVVRVAAEFGVRRVRLTGASPSCGGISCGWWGCCGSGAILGISP